MTTIQNDWQCPACATKTHPITTLDPRSPVTRMMVIVSCPACAWSERHAYPLQDARSMTTA